eukprot:153575-Amphidinium_carterae.1
MLRNLQGLLFMSQEVLHARTTPHCRQHIRVKLTNKPSTHKEQVSKATLLLTEFLTQQVPCSKTATCQIGPPKKCRLV